MRRTGKGPGSRYDANSPRQLESDEGDQHLQYFNTENAAIDNFEVINNLLEAASGI